MEKRLKQLAHNQEIVDKCEELASCLSRDFYDIVSERLETDPDSILPKLSYQLYDGWLCELHGLQRNYKPMDRCDELPPEAFIRYGSQPLHKWRSTCSWAKISNRDVTTIASLCKEKGIKRVVSIFAGSGLFEALLEKKLAAEGTDCEVIATDSFPDREHSFGTRFEKTFPTDVRRMDAVEAVTTLAGERTVILCIYPPTPRRALVQGAWMLRGRHRWPRSSTSATAPRLGRLETSTGTCAPNGSLWRRTATRRTPGPR